MVKYYADSEEKYLNGVVLYASGDVGDESLGLYYDAEGTKQAHKSDYDWDDLFCKGLIRVCVSGPISNFYNPYRLRMNDDVSMLYLDSANDVNASFFADESLPNPATIANGNNK